MTWNVLASWAGHFVFLVAGFVLPRCMDRSLGQAALGVWDFAWSVVAYFGLVQMGIASSVNRYVAQYRAKGDVENLCCTVSSVWCVLLVAAGLAATLAAAGSALVPWLAASRLGAFVDDARWLLLLLGLSLAVQIAFAAFDGVITGCHRWGLHNGITAGSYALSVTGMLSALLMGKGLATLAAVYLGGVVVGELTRVAVAFQVCPELRVRFRLARWGTTGSMIAFGGKTFVPRMAELLLNQAVSIMIVAHVGPAALALFSRPRSLVYHIHRLVSKLACVLTPTTSSLQALESLPQNRNLLIRSTRYAAYLALPLLLIVLILGDPLLRLWMGSNYAATWLPAVLAMGLAPTILHQTGWSVLTGLNAHGRAGAARLIAALCTVGLVMLTLGPLNGGLIGAAVAIVVPLAVVDGIYLPLCTCRQFDMRFSRFLVSAYRGPAAAAIPFAGCLLTARIFLSDHPPLCLSAGVGAGCALLARTYWKHVLPDRLRSRIASSLRFSGVLSETAKTAI